MAAVSFTCLLRGADTVSIDRDGVAWVHHDGSITQDAKFAPKFGTKASRNIRGVLLCIPARKNNQHSPAWILIMNKAVLRLLAQHITFLNSSMPNHLPLFIAPPSRRAGFDPSKRISVNTFRTLTRKALQECGNLSQQEANAYGTHSFRIGAVELLRKRGVPSELRRQLGGWMSRTAALGYLQLSPSAQLDVLQSL